MPINNGGTGKYTEMKVFNTTITDNVKYNKPKELDGIQEDPKKMKVEHFKQDYVVMIRKKLYYASSSVSDEYYLRLYQLNNFSSVRTSISTSGRSGSCSVVIKGGERVVCAERPQEEAKAWSSYEEMLNGWTNIDDEGIDGTYDSRFEGKERIWRVGNDDWADKNAKGIDYKNVMKAREHKYGWKFAEKCDFEPMDELIVFGKSRSKRRNTKKNEFEMQPIFFGYIDSIQKTYQAGKGGLQINISASDHLKLLELGKVINSPSLIPGKFSGNGIDLRYNVDEFGCFVINDPFSDIKSGVKTAEDISEYYAFSNVFAGKYPYEIITQLAIDSGIPKKYLTKRIEQIKMVPFVTQLKNNSSGDLFNADLFNRADVCRQAAEKLFLEFYADEAGNIVLKIPNYALGCNRLPDNNMGYSFPEDIVSDLGYSIKEKTDNTKNSSNNASNKVKKVTYTVKQGDTYESIARTYLYKGALGTELQQINGDISVGKKITIYKRDVTDPVANEEALKLMKNDSNIKNNNAAAQAGYSFTDGESLSMKTDHLIRRIEPQHLISFTLTDTDKEIYNMFEIQAETYMNIYQDNPMTCIRRAVPDVPSIVRFGLRPFPSTYNTPLITNDLEAEIFGILMCNMSMAKRYSGSITLIEDADIKVGDPIVLLTYDEHPIPETGNYEDRGQTVFYVTGIERNISTQSTSTMTLSVIAGRMMGQESIYDICYPIYKMYYQEKADFSFLGSKNEESVSSSLTYKIKSADTIQKIIKANYGVVDANQLSNIYYKILILNKDLFGNNSKLMITDANTILSTSIGKTLNLP